MQRARRDREDAAISENTQTKKRTQSPPENPDPETVNHPAQSSTGPAKEETIATEDPQNTQNEKTNPNVPDVLKIETKPDFDRLSDTVAVPRTPIEKTNPKP
jgi:hypothetical protein